MGFHNIPGVNTFTELAGGENKNVAVVNTWEDWDISAIVPSGAKYAEITRDSILSTVRKWGVRKNGSALARHFINIGAACPSLTVELDADRIIEIYSGSLTTGNFNVMGYWS